MIREGLATGCMQCPEAGVRLEGEYQARERSYLQHIDCKRKWGRGGERKREREEEEEEKEEEEEAEKEEEEERGRKRRREKSQRQERDRKEIYSSKETQKDMPVNPPVQDPGS